MRAPDSSRRLWLLAAPALFLLLFYFYPLARILGTSLMPEGRLRLDAFQKLCTHTYYLRILWFTFWQAALSTLITLTAALPAAYVFARYRFAGKRLLQSFATVPFVMPTVVVAAAFQALLGPAGVVNGTLMKWFHLAQPPIALTHTVTFILLAHLFFNFAVALRIIGGYWTHLPPAMTEAARMLGAGPLTCFRRITLPLLRPAVFGAALLIFVFCFCSFGIVLILGGPRYATIEVAIYRQAVHLFNLPMAAALSLVQIVITLALMAGYTHLARRTQLTVTPTAARVAQKPIATAADAVIVSLVIGLMLLLLAPPLLALVVRSLRVGGGWSLAFYRALAENRTQSYFFVPPVQAILNSLGFAIATLVLALGLGLLTALFLAGPRTRLAALLDPIFMLPLSTSAVTLGFGFILALDRPPLNLRTSLAIVPLAHCLVALPFVVRALLPALRSIPQSLRETASLLGASPATVRRVVDLPIVGRALLVGAVFAFTISLGEFGATAFIARPQTPTLPVAIYRFLGQPGALNYGQAMAMSSLLMLVTTAGFLFLERFRTGTLGEF